MKTLFTALVLATFTLGAGAAYAADAPAPAKAADKPAAAAPAAPAADTKALAPKDAMKACSGAGKGKKGDEYKTFMSDCLKAKGPANMKPAVAAPAAPAADTKALAPKDAMKACSGAGKGKKGDEYKKFMSDCLKAKGPANMK